MSRPLRKKATGGRCEPRIAAGEDTALRGKAERSASPIRHTAAGAGDHRHQRGEVVGFQARLHDKVDEPRREQPIGVAVAAESGELDRTLEALKALRVRAPE